MAENIPTKKETGEKKQDSEDKSVVHQKDERQVKEKQEKEQPEYIEKQSGHKDKEGI